MTQAKKFSEQPLPARISTIAVLALLGLLGLALIAIGAGFVWKAVLWAWS